MERFTQRFSAAVVPDAEADADDLSPELFARFAALIEARSGIHLPPRKRALLRGRLARRLRALELTSYADYLVLVSADPEEALELVNVVTTNKTSFFREPHHFEALAAHVAGWDGGTGALRIWSAGCSTGEEAWSAAMAAREALGGRDREVRVLATDIDTAVLEHARRAIYRDAVLADIPGPLVTRWLRQGIGEFEGHVRVCEELRGCVRFGVLNLAQPPWPLRAKFDVVLCRNTLIYFAPATQQRVVDGLIEHLLPGGLLMVGHSEGMLGARPELERVDGTTFRRRAAP
jgi:chemotaxis protein methyltransferase CheR